ncbi:hypothetical protein MRK42_17220 [Aeromonas sp. 19NY04SH05-1]|uniref:Uncharacterized protein n=1 Tax=Aeromonas sp. 19NY04SH05-1 TaxID=2920537 RepID=A0AAU6T6F4_9GAMM
MNIMISYHRLVRTFLNGKEVWKLSLYMISNEAVPIDVNEMSIKQLIDFYDMEVISLCLPDIKNMMSIRPAPISAEMIIDQDALMSYSESSISTSKSYIVRMCASDIIRITSKNSDLRLNYNLEDLNLLAREKLEYGVLFDNVRGFVQRSKESANKQVISSQAGSLIKISRIRADCSPVNTSN